MGQYNLEKLIVNFKNTTYPIRIGFNILEVPNIFFPLKKNSQVMLVTNSTIAKLWKKSVVNCLSELGVKITSINLLDGEEYKTISSMELVISKLLNNFHDRTTTLIALGGGVIGDITGFVASIYQRGVSFIQIPTTLLSQVDAAIGGKTSVNHLLGKNMIGSFWQPISVITDLRFLNTLPTFQFVSGMAEVVKYAIAFDQSFFNWLEMNWTSILNLDEEKITYCIKRCCEIKIGIVQKDEKENGNRVLLNLGHTFAHAIETFLGYGIWTHGEAVSVGIVMASELSKLLGFLNTEDVNRIVSLLKNIGLPVKGPKNMDIQSYLLNFMRDKKIRSGILRIILPRNIGHAIIVSNIKKDTLMSAISVCQ